jgi:hypothetical protein
VFSGAPPFPPPIQCSSKTPAFFPAWKNIAQTFNRNELSAGVRWTFAHPEKLTKNSHPNFLLGLQYQIFTVHFLLLAWISSTAKESFAVATIFRQTFDRRLGRVQYVLLGLRHTSTLPSIC